MQDINFFDHYQRQEQEEKKLGPLAFIIIAASLLVVGSGVLTYQTWNLNKEISQLESTLADPKLALEIQRAEKLARELEALTSLDTQISEVVSGIDSRDANISQALLAISSVIPQTITLDQTSLNASLITMTASATTRQAIAEFQYNLKQLGLFSDVYIGTIQPTSGDGSNFNFQIQCQIGGTSNETE